MKRLKDPNTMMIAVAMMLVSVAALMFFTVPVEYLPPPSPEELAPILGDWVPIIPDDPTDSSYNGKSFTLRDDLYCDFDALGKRCQYTYDTRRQTVTVLLPENPTEGMTYTLETYQGFAALKLGDRYYVREADHALAWDKYQLELDLQPPEIIQRTEAELAPVLGRWKNWTGKSYPDQRNIFYWQDISLFEDMTCRFLPSGHEYSYNYDPETKAVTVYCSPQRSKAIVYTVTEQAGMTMLHCADSASASGGQQHVDPNELFYVREKHYNAAHEIYIRQTQPELLRKHRATREILLEGKVSFAEKLPYRYKDDLFVAAIFPDHYGMHLFMVTSETAKLKVSDALKNVRLVSTSIHENWTQKELEDHYSIPLTQISAISEGHGTVVTDQTLVTWSEYFDASAIIEHFNNFGISYYYSFELSPKDPWKVEDLGYQDLFIFFEVYGEDDVFYIQLDA